LRNSKGFQGMRTQFDWWGATAQGTNPALRDHLPEAPRSKPIPIPPAPNAFGAIGAVCFCSGGQRPPLQRDCNRRCGRVSIGYE